jgi:hypothetical protein
MPLLSGTANFIEFTVPEEAVFDPTSGRVLAHLFMDIDDSYDNISIGLVPVFDMFSKAPPFLELGDYVITALRVDERKVPGAVLKKLVAKEIHQVCAKKQLPRLSRAAKIDIRERVFAELIRKTPPSPVVADIVWSVNDRRLFLFSTNNNVLEVFEELFIETFGACPQAVVYENSDDFLAWCWWKSESISLGGRMVIGDDDARVTCSGGPEAFKALALEKKIRKAAVAFETGASGVLTPGLGQFNGVKLPKVPTPPEIDYGHILDRIAQFTELADTVKAEYAQFTLSSVSGLQDWIAEQQNSGLGDN